MIYDVIIAVSFSCTILCCILGLLSKDKKQIVKHEIGVINWMGFTN